MSEPQTEPTEPTETPDAEPVETPQEPQEEPTTPEGEPEPVAPEPDEGEPQEPSEPTGQGASAEEWAKRISKAEQRFATYEKAIFGIFEDDAHDLIDCPLCLGAARGFIDRNMLGHFPPEQVAIIKQVIGITAEMEYPTSSRYRTCQECQGTGRVQTGSHVAGQENIGCGECNERGWIGPDRVQSNGHIEPGPAPVTLAPVVQEGASDDVDEWNEPRILPDGRVNPNFGRMPHRKIQVEPWGTTAGLTAQDAVTT